MNIDKKFNPTEHENRAAIEAISSQLEPNPYEGLTDARAGKSSAIHGTYEVVATNLNVKAVLRVASFHYNPNWPMTVHSARQMAESLARQINGQSR